MLASALTVSWRIAAALPRARAISDIATYVHVAAPPDGRAPVVTPIAGPVDRDLQYGPRDRQRLDLYLPNAAVYPGPRPTLIWLHGGGWRSWDRRDTTPIIQREIGRGFAVASVDYALVPASHFPAALDDVKLAIRWLKANGRRYGLDARNLVVAGGSSGAYLATMAAVTPGRMEPREIPPALRGVDDDVAAVIDFAGPTDLVAFDRHDASNPTIREYARWLGTTFLGCAQHPSPRCAPGLEHRASIAPHLSHRAPPIFMAYGATDELVPFETQELPLAAQWAAATGPNTVWAQVVPRTGHNITLAGLNDDALDRFLAEVVNRSIGR